IASGHNNLFPTTNSPCYYRSPTPDISPAAELQLQMDSGCQPLVIGGEQRRDPAPGNTTSTSCHDLPRSGTTAPATLGVSQNSAHCAIIPTRNSYRVER